jgi:hypothetical protein
MRSRKTHLDGREDELGRLIEEKAGEGRTVWASFDWALQVDLYMALEQQERLSELVGTHQLVVKTAALEEAVDEWSAAALRRAQSFHSGTIFASETGLSLSRDADAAVLRRKRGR